MIYTCVCHNLMWLQIWFVANVNYHNTCNIWCGRAAMITFATCPGLHKFHIIIRWKRVAKYPLSPPPLSYLVLSRKLLSFRLISIGVSSGPKRTVHALPRIGGPSVRPTRLFAVVMREEERSISLSISLLQKWFGVWRQSEHFISITMLPMWRQPACNLVFLLLLNVRQNWLWESQSRCAHLVFFKFSPLSFFWMKKSFFQKALHFEIMCNQIQQTASTSCLDRLVAFATRTLEMKAAKLLVQHTILVLFSENACL